MRAGDLRNRLYIEQKSTVDGTTGAPVTRWGHFAAVWGAIQPVGGTEAKNQEQLQPDVTHTIRLRYGGLVTPATFTPEHRIRFGVRSFEVSSVINVDERKRELVVSCTERV